MDTGTQVSTSVTILNSLLGYQGISLTNYTASAVSSISEGSKLEVAGAFFTWAADELPNASSWTAIASTTSAYLQCTPSGSAGTQILSASWTTTAPTFSVTKQGWYASAASNVRVIASAYKTAAGAASQNGKKLYELGQTAKQDDLPIGTILMFDGSGWVDAVTLPGWYACIAANAGVGCPDLLNRFIMGKVVAGAGATGGSNTHTIASGELPTHTHDLANHAHEISVFGSGAGATWAIRDATTFSGVSNSGGPSSNTSGNGGFANTAIDTKPAYYSVIFIRKCY